MINMTIEIVPSISNREPSDKLHSMLVNLENNTKAIFDSIEEIRTQARSEGFEDFETDLLLKPYLIEAWAEIELSIYSAIRVEEKTEQSY
jgi:hypothetical protein